MKGRTNSFESPMLIVIAFLAAHVCSSAFAQQTRTELRIWGTGAERGSANPLLDTLVELERGFQHNHPEVTFTHRLSGNDSALGGLYTGAADLVFMDREPSYIELDAYQQALPGQKPVTIPLMRGGTKSVGHSSPLVLVTHKGNPLTRLTQTDLNRLFNAALKQNEHAVTWSDVGLRGSWSGRSVVLYGLKPESAEGRSFAGKVMSGSRRWVCGYRQFGSQQGGLQAARDVVRAVRDDPEGLGLTTLDAVEPGVRVIAVGKNAEAAVLPSVEALSSGKYLLGRTVSVLVKVDVAHQMSSVIRPFLEYLASEEARAALLANGNYIPLSDESLTREREALP